MFNSRSRRKNSGSARKAPRREEGVEARARPSIQPLHHEPAADYRYLRSASAATTLSAD